MGACVVEESIQFTSFRVRVELGKKLVKLACQTSFVPAHDGIRTKIRCLQEA